MKKVFSWLERNTLEIFGVFLMSVLITLFILLAVGMKTNGIKKVEGLPNRFEILEEFQMGPKVYRVIKDLGTNVLYLVGPDGIQLLVDYKGDPVTWDPFGG